MSGKSVIITKTSEIVENVFMIDHTIRNGESLLISVRDVQGATRTLLELEAGTLYEINIKATITDKKVEF